MLYFNMTYNNAYAPVMASPDMENGLESGSALLAGEFYRQYLQPPAPLENRFKTRAELGAFFAQVQNDLIYPPEGRAHDLNGILPIEARLIPRVPVSESDAPSKPALYATLIQNGRTDPRRHFRQILFALSKYHKVLNVVNGGMNIVWIDIRQPAKGLLREDQVGNYPEDLACGSLPPPPSPQNPHHRQDGVTRVNFTYGADGVPRFNSISVMSQREMTSIEIAAEVLANDLIQNPRLFAVASALNDNPDLLQKFVEENEAFDDYVEYSEKNWSICPKTGKNLPVSDGSVEEPVPFDSTAAALVDEFLESQEATAADSVRDTPPTSPCRLESMKEHQEQLAAQDKIWQEERCPESYAFMTPEQLATYIDNIKSHHQQFRDNLEQKMMDRRFGFRHEPNNEKTNKND